MRTQNIPKNITLNYPKSAAMVFFIFKGLENELETAMVYEPSVLEPLKFHCIWFDVSFALYGVKVTGP